MTAQNISSRVKLTSSSFYEGPAKVSPTVNLICSFWAALKRIQNAELCSGDLILFFLFHVFLLFFFCGGASDPEEVIILVKKRAGPPQQNDISKNKKAVATEL